MWDKGMGCGGAMEPMLVTMVSYKNYYGQGQEDDSAGKGAIH